MPRGWIVGLIVAVIGGTPAAVNGQSSEPDKPAPLVFRGLFGPAERDEKRPPALNLTFSLYGAVDDNSRFASGEDVSDQTLQARRGYEGAQATLTFARRRPQSTFRVDGSSGLRYYSGLRQIVTQKHSGSVAFEFTPSARTKAQLAQSASFSPYYQLVLGRPVGGELGAMEPAAASSDHSISRQKQMVYGSSAALTYTAGPRGVITAAYSRQYTDFFQGRDFTSDRIGGRYTHQISPGVDLRLGYGFGSGTLAGRTASTHHDIDVGLNYGRSFTFARRTALGFTSGSTVVSADGEQHLQWTGSAQLRQQLSSSTRWTAQLAYDRGFQVLENVPHPFLAGTVSGSLNGFITRRISLRVIPSYTKGVDVADSRLAYHGFVGQTRLDFAVSRYGALYLEHFYYGFRFSGGAMLPPELAAGLDRHGVRAGLALWAPLIR